MPHGAARARNERKGANQIAKRLKNTRKTGERAVLVSVAPKRGRQLWTQNDSLDELAELARTAGATVVERVSQRVERQTQTYLGKGKLEDLKRMCGELSLETVICDDELTPTQQRNLEDALGGRKVIDRAALILDVFASRARTREGRLQVELAQHEYLLPRLAGQWTHLERLGGGIGTRGPGETQIETDRRLARGRIRRLKKELEGVRRHRGLSRARRAAGDVPVISLVGYTNAGKSTLLNRLTRAGVRAENLMFSTLDPVTRRIRLPSGRAALLTDTVGFIHKLPPALVAAFRATLEEISEASLILHVVDSAHRNAPERIAVVDSILDEIGLGDIPTLTALNKSDLPTESETPDAASRFAAGVGVQDGVPLSALSGEGVDDLLAEIDAALPASSAYRAPEAVVV